ncbi:hypothetical protein MSG28_012224 [Choristoneura fumiferana]|uniref:Uncharacterized protein n=1 Tax=Choristoneura fumiferana TaxID=7141 RepID=A0ACC0KCY6_CHOFU|nr:hypothetical protein MSG28_012224 [Choristoneura fumiferana]
MEYDDSRRRCFSSDCYGSESWILAPKIVGRALARSRGAAAQCVSLRRCARVPPDTPGHPKDVIVRFVQWRPCVYLESTRSDSELYRGILAVVGAVLLLQGRRWICGVSWRRDQCYLRGESEIRARGRNWCAGASDSGFSARAASLKIVVPAHAPAPPPLTYLRHPRPRPRNGKRGVERPPTRWTDELKLPTEATGDLWGALCPTVNVLGTAGMMMMIMMKTAMSIKERVEFIHIFRN